MISRTPDCTSVERNSTRLCCTLIVHWGVVAERRLVQNNHSNATVAVPSPQHLTTSVQDGSRCSPALRLHEMLLRFPLILSLAIVGAELPEPNIRGVQRPPIVHLLLEAFGLEEVWPPVINGFRVQVLSTQAQKTGVQADRQGALSDGIGWIV